MGIQSGASAINVLALMRQILINSFVLLMLSLVAGIAAGPVAAQNVAIDGAGTAELEALTATLEDEAKREAFIKQLRALIASQRATVTQPSQRSAGANFFDDINRRVDSVSSQMVSAAATLLDIPAQARRIQGKLSGSEARAKLATAVGGVILVLLTGILAHWVGQRLLGGPRGTVEARTEDRLWLRISLLVFRTLLDLVPVLAFAAAAYGALVFLDPEKITRLIAVAIINASLLTRAILVVARLVFAPHVETLRILSIADETANYVYVWIRRLTYLSIYGFFAIDVALLLGLPGATYAVFVKLLGLAIGLLLIMIVVQNRQQVSARIRGQANGAIGNVRRRIADIWHILLILYLIAVYFVWVFEVAGGFQFALRATLLTLVIGAVARLFVAAANQAIRRGFALSHDVKSRLPGLETRANLYLPWLQAGVRTLIYVFATFAVLQAWGLGIFAWLAEPAGRALVSKVFSIVLIIAAAIIVWEIISATIERYLEATDENGSEVARSQRIRTLLPLFRNFVFVVLAVIVTLTVLSEIGVNIAPLLAGAGVVGLAVGFGAQTLVKDVITGLLFLIEDAIAVGDVVQVGSHSGVVEAVTVRSLRLRDLSGTVHQIPFSEVSSVVNMTKDFSFAIMDIGVAYRENVDDVIEVIKQIGANLREDPEIGPSILEDIEVLGLDRFDDSAVIIRARFKTQPIKQWAVRRAFNRLLKQKFDELGIEIPFPHQTIYFGEDKEGRAPVAPVRLEPQRE